MARSAGEALEEMVAQLSNRPERTAGLEATYGFDFSGPGGGRWHVVFTAGRPTLRAGAPPAADTDLAMAADDFVALHDGELEGSVAFATGRMRVSGDLTLGMRLGELLRPDGAERAVTPEPILSVATGFMAAKHLFVANELDVFTHLAGGPLTLQELAGQVGAPAPALRIVVDALVGLELLEHDGGRYANGRSAAMYLTGRSPVDLRPFLRFWDQVAYDRWRGLAAAVQRHAAVDHPLSDEQQRLVAEGVESVTGAGTAALSSAYPFERHRHLLDAAGGTGSYLRAVLRNRPQLRGTLLELPAVAAIARRRLAGDPVEARVAVVEGDLLHDPIPSGCDAVLLANVVHVFQPATNQALLRRLRDQVEEGTALLLVDTWTTEDRSTPLRAALVAGEYLTASGGDVFSIGDVRSWFDATGWRFVEHKALVGPSGLVVGTAAPR